MVNFGGKKFLATPLIEKENRTLFEHDYSTKCVAWKAEPIGSGNNRNKKVKPKTHTNVKSFKRETCRDKYNPKGTVRSHKFSEKAERSVMGKNIDTKADMYVKHKTQVTVESFNHKRSGNKLTSEETFRPPTRKEKVDLKDINTNAITYTKTQTKTNVDLNKCINVRTVNMHAKSQELLNVGPCEPRGDKSNSKETFLSHTRGKKMDSSGVFKCDKCGKMFIRPRNFQQHLIKHKSERSYVCTLCGKCFANKGNLLAHSHLHTLGKLYTYVCVICGMTFTEKELLVKHLESHSHIKEKQCKSDTSEEDTVHQRDTCYQKCHFCGRNFPDNKALDEHPREKHLKTDHDHSKLEEKQFKCNVCGQSYTWKSFLSHHLYTNHPTQKEERPFKCSTCGKAFTRETTLQLHNHIHTVEKPFKCDMCDEQFNFQVTLVNHSRIHTGENPYKCEACGKDFNTVSQLQKHRMRWHPHEWPYSCAKCGKGFKHNSYLKTHKCKPSSVKRSERITIHDYITTKL